MLSVTAESVWVKRMSWVHWGAYLVAWCGEEGGTRTARLAKVGWGGVLWSQDPRSYLQRLCSDHCILPETEGNIQLGHMGTPGGAEDLGNRGHTRSQHLKWVGSLHTDFVSLRKRQIFTNLHACLKIDFTWKTGHTIYKLPDLRSIPEYIEMIKSSLSSCCYQNTLSYL